VQEYLDSARKGGELGRSAGVPFRFLFYLRKDDAASPAEASQQDPPGLQCFAPAGSNAANPSCH
jgi:hypothetical protein